MTAEDAKEYLASKNIPELFQSLTVGLLHHRPENPFQYLTECLDHVSNIGWQNVVVDTFRSMPSSHSSAVSTVDEWPKKTTKSNHNNKDAIKDAEEEEFKRIISGSLNDLPQLPSNVIRIFLSSTFSDFKAERNALARIAYPQLEENCNERGLDFQVVDLRWGVTDEVINDHQVSELCLREIATCQSVSAGPNFVMLIGDRYGHRPFPYYINSDEFDLLMDIVSNEYKENVKVIRDWYHRDDNSVPPRYVLQPIVSKLKYYNSMEDEHTDKKHADIVQWEELSRTIQSTLRKASKLAVKKGIMKKSASEKYFISG